MKLNCWEFMKCGRGPAGDKVNEYGACPCAQEKKLNGVHGGVNAGRACWMIPGNGCGGGRSDFDRKFENCFNCDFYKLVIKEEGLYFVEYRLLLKKMK